jgi:4-aminobutyrate aminotransferase-like enzyme
MLTWAPGKARHGTPIITHGEGVYLYDDKGNKLLDWTSQAVCSNAGYTLPDAVIEATTKQMRDLPFVYGGLGITEVRARLSKLMTEILPGDLHGMVFPSSGSEANEAAITRENSRLSTGIVVTTVVPPTRRQRLVTFADGMVATSFPDSSRHSALTLFSGTMLVPPRRSDANRP